MTEDLHVGAGDVLVIRVPMGTDDFTYDRICDDLVSRMPEDMRGRVMVVRAEQLAVIHASDRPLTERAP